jgi:hypothetical protein
MVIIGMLYAPAPSCLTGESVGLPILFAAWI